LNNPPDRFHFLSRKNCFSIPVDGESKIKMTNPWHRIPASDYEGHMGHPDVGQLSFLACTFQEAMNDGNATTIALLGCATGNGLEYVKPDRTKRVTAIDINDEYLNILRQRYEGHIPGLEVVEADLTVCDLEQSAYSLIYAGLLFEYINPQILLPRIARWLQPDGLMVVVLQLPVNNHLKKVSETPFSSLKLLESVMLLVSPEEMKSVAEGAGLREVQAKNVTLKSGKSFFIGTYAKT
jgi:SAM-dependent methyltransferase